MELTKGTEVWLADAGKGPYGSSGYSGHDIRVDRGVVTGGGPQMVIVRWDDLTRTYTPSGEDRMARYRAERRYSPTREDALRRLYDQLDRDLEYTIKQQEIILAAKRQVLEALESSL